MWIFFYGKSPRIRIKNRDLHLSTAMWTTYRFPLVYIFPLHKKEKIGYNHFIQKARTNSGYLIPVNSTGPEFRPLSTEGGLSCPRFPLPHPHSHPTLPFRIPFLHSICHPHTAPMSRSICFFCIAAFTPTLRSQRRRPLPLSI